MRGNKVSRPLKEREIDLYANIKNKIEEMHVKG